MMRAIYQNLHIRFTTNVVNDVNCSCSFIDSPEISVAYLVHTLHESETRLCYVVHSCSNLLIVFPDVRQWEFGTIYFISFVMNSEGNKNVYTLGKSIIISVFNSKEDITGFISESCIVHQIIPKLI